MAEADMADNITEAPLEAEAPDRLLAFEIRCAGADHTSRRGEIGHQDVLGTSSKASPAAMLCEACSRATEAAAAGAAAEADAEDERRVEDVCKILNLGRDELRRVLIRATR